MAAELAMARAASEMQAATKFAANAPMHLPKNAKLRTPCSEGQLRLPTQLATSETNFSTNIARHGCIRESPQTRQLEQNHEKWSMGSNQHVTREHQNKVIRAKSAQRNGSRATWSHQHHRSTAETKAHIINLALSQIELIPQHIL